MALIMVKLFINTIVFIQLQFIAILIRLISFKTNAVASYCYDVFILSILTTTTTVIVIIIKLIIIKLNLNLKMSSNQELNHALFI
jgi:hypothetical protein